MKLPFDYNPAARMTRTFHIDNVDPRKVAIETVQDKEPYYKLAQAIRNEDVKPKLHDWGRYVGEIPYEDYMQLCKEYPDLRARGAPGAAAVRQKTLRKILQTHPGRFKWLYWNKF